MEFGNCDMKIRLLTPLLTVSFCQILKCPPGRFDLKTLCVPAYSGIIHLFFFRSVYQVRFYQCPAESIDDVVGRRLQSALKLTLFRISSGEAADPE